MFFIAWRNLFQEKGRLLISIGGVAFSVTLIVILAGLYQGWRTKIGEYIRTVPADIWVMQSGSEELFHTPSVLPLSIGNKLTSIEGVASAKPFNARRVAIPVGDKELNLYIVAYDSGNDVGKPARVVEGKSEPESGEIIIDRSQQNKVKIGDKVAVGQNELKVVGFADGGDLVTSSFAFAKKSELNKIQQLPNAANFFVVKVKPGFETSKVIDEIKSKVPGVNAVTKEKFVSNNTKIITDTFLPVILVLLLIGIAVGIAIIGLTIFTSTIEKAKEYGVLKAMGMKNRQLYGVVIEQALIAGVLGYCFGILLAYVLSITVGRYVAQFVTQFQFTDVALIFGLTIVMSILAAYIPIRRIAHIDPAEVFKA